MSTKDPIRRRELTKARMQRQREKDKNRLDLIRSQQERELAAKGLTRGCELPLTNRDKANGVTSKRDGSWAGMAPDCKIIAPSSSSNDCCRAKPHLWTCIEGHKRPLTFFGESAYQMHREIEHA